jgi:hypothetical protein
MKIRLLALALMAAFAAGCQSGSHAASSAALHSDASGATVYRHHHRRHHAAAKAVHHATGKCPYPPLPSTAQSSIGFPITPRALDCKARRLAAAAEREGRAGFMLRPVHPETQRCWPAPKSAGASPGAVECATVRLTPAARREGHKPIPGFRVCLTADFTPGSNGAGIQGWPVRLTVIPGRVYKFHVGVSNPGSGSEDAELRIQNDGPFCSHVLPPSWISGTLQPLGLGPGQSAQMPLWIRVPAGTPPGTWRSEVVNFAGPPIVAGRVNIEAAAGTNIIVTVS